MFTHLLTNYIFIGILLLTATLQVLIVEFGSTVFRTELLTAHNWFISMAIRAPSGNSCWLRLSLELMTHNIMCSTASARIIY